MSNKARGLKSAIDAFILRRGIEAGMDQNLMKEAIHLHLLSALSDTGILQHVVFQALHRRGNATSCPKRTSRISGSASV